MRDIVFTLIGAVSGYKAIARARTDMALPPRMLTGSTIPRPRYAAMKFASCSAALPSRSSRAASLWAIVQARARRNPHADIERRSVGRCSGSAQPVPQHNVTRACCHRDAIAARMQPRPHASHIAALVEQFRDADLPDVGLTPDYKCHAFPDEARRRSAHSALYICTL
jgi:hypothetical protein